MFKIAPPAWYATTWRVAKERLSRTRSTSYRTGWYSSPAAHEVGVQRLRTVRRVDGEARGTQRLRHDLSAVQASPTERRAPAEERVGLDLLEREQRRKIGDGMYRDHSSDSRIPGDKCPLAVFGADDTNACGIEHEAVAFVRIEPQRDRDEYPRGVPVTEAQHVAVGVGDEIEHARRPGRDVGD